MSVVQAGPQGRISGEKMDKPLSPQDGDQKWPSSADKAHSKKGGTSSSSTGNNTSASEVSSEEGEGALFDEQDQNQIKDDLYKTELCKKWMQTGSCRYATKCRFAHGYGELRSLVRHPLYKTSLCKSFQASGSCRYGTRCRFIHDETEEYLSRVPRGASKSGGPEGSGISRVPSAPASLNAYNNISPGRTRGGAGHIHGQRQQNQLPQYRQFAPGDTHAINGSPNRAPLRVQLLQQQTHAKAGIRMHQQQHQHDAATHEQQLFQQQFTTPLKGVPTQQQQQQQQHQFLTAGGGGYGQPFRQGEHAMQSSRFGVTSASAIDLSSLNQHLPPAPGFPPTYQDFKNQSARPQNEIDFAGAGDGLFSGFAPQLDAKQIPVASSGTPPQSGHANCSPHNSPRQNSESGGARRPPSGSDAELHASASAVALSTLASPDSRAPSSPGNESFQQGVGGSSSMLDMGSLALPPRHHGTSSSQHASIGRSASQPAFLEQHQQLQQQHRHHFLPRQHSGGQSSQGFAHPSQSHQHDMYGSMSYNQQRQQQLFQQRQQQKGQQQQQQQQQSYFGAGEYEQNRNVFGHTSALSSGNGDPMRKAASVNELSTGLFNSHQGSFHSTSGPYFFQATAEESDEALASQAQQEEGGIFY